MSLFTTLVLGAIAGLTIFLGLPVGRLRSPAPNLRVILTATSIGVLVFLLWDVLSAAWAPLDEALAAVHAGDADLGRLVGLGVLFVGGLATGLLGLVCYEGWMRRRDAPARVRFGPGAMSVGELSAGARVSFSTPARRLALLIAVGIGLHNFAEGLAIGTSAASGEIALATVLVVGFALHNATEGFGIVAPLAAEEGSARPSWRFLGLLGLIGGGPTVVGVAVGHRFTSEPLSIAFLTLAAGSILYVICQLVTVAAKARRTDLVAYGMLIGLLAGFATDAILIAGGV